MLHKQSGGPENAAPASERPTPHNIEAEQALLGAILMQNEALDRVGDLIAAHYFFDPLHERIFDTVEREVAAGRRVTPITLKPFFDNEPQIGQVSVAGYLGRLVSHATSLLNVRDYALTIRDLWMRREMMAIGDELVAAGGEMAPDAPPVDQIAETEARLFQLGQSGSAATVHEFSAADASAAALAMIARAYGREGGLAGIGTGFADLDRHLGGLSPSDLIIIAGRPSMGKSALASNIAFNVAGMLAAAHESGEPAGEVSFYSLEMSAEQVLMREIARRSGIAADRLRRGTLNEDGTAHAEPLQEFSRKVKPASEALGALPVHIDATGGLKLGQFIARARRRKRLHNTQLIVVDYLQLMTTGKRSDNRQAEVAEITVALKGLAKELGVPIIALSQLSRAVESRPDKRPQLSDLRESGAIEQDADIVLFVYREEYYLSRTEPPASKADEYQAWQDAMRDVAGVAEIITGKQRHGPIGIVKLHFHSATTAFSNLAAGGAR